MILGIYGANGLGREILNLSLSVNAHTATWERIVFIDDFSKESHVNDAPVLSFDVFQAKHPHQNAKIAIAVGEPSVRKALRDKVAAAGYGLESLVHPSAFIGTGTSLGTGSIIQYGSFVSCHVMVGDNVLVQALASIGHDSSIGSDAVISSHVGISGNCSVGEQTYIGVNVPIKENTAIGAHTIVGMGAVVLRDIPENVIAVGNPARVVKNNEEGRVFK